MKSTILIFAFMASTLSCIGQTEKQIENLKAFAKSYGYVKYFHPSDEAALIDWNNFAIYGAAQIEKCTTEKEAVATLENLFMPLAPSAKFQLSKTPSTFDVSKIKPENTKGYKLSYWQHKGVTQGMNMKNSPYSSVRVNRKSKIDNSDPFGNIMTSIDATKYKDKEIKYTGWVKMEEGSTGTGHLWFRVDNTNKAMGFLDNMGNRPIKESQWKQYEITLAVDSDASSFALGCFLKGKGKLFLDDIELAYKEGDDWIEIPIKYSDFEGDDVGGKKNDVQWAGKGSGYEFTTLGNDKHEGEKSAVISFVGATTEVKGSPIFDFKPEFGELIQKNISANIVCQIPLVLYADDENTYPKSKEEKLTFLQKEIDKNTSDATSLAFRLGNIISTYNVFQHFYPYFDVVDVDWDTELEKALLRSYTDKTGKDHLITLQKLTATLRDGHINVSGGIRETFVPPILWEWVEDKLIVSQIFDDEVGLAVGDIITHINEKTAIEYFDEINSRISAGTKGWLDHKAKNSSLYGPEDSEINITVGGKKLSLKRTKEYFAEIRPFLPQRDSQRKISDDIFYLNLDNIPMDDINELLPELKKYKSIICDMRGYPNGNHRFIRHLLKSNDTTEAWMQVPKLVYPDQEDLVGYEEHNWKMNTKKPYLGDKQIIFITDGSAISYAESYMGYIEGYKLATIIGQPTAGTNGNVNSFELPGGFGIRWTGMKVVKHDGSQHHGIGVLPNIYVEKTIEGVKAGRDEFLEVAIDLAQKEQIDPKANNRIKD